MAIVLLGAMVIGAVAAGVVWVAQEGHPAGDRVVGALAAGGATFIGVATLAFVIGSFLTS
ncbi:hypothetical protein [Streptomyces hyaluromycini]|uniref:hypothetical protein n=1 Tax=Streptomyces hyaluromycini TaxID=1377993 RepID=UPI0011AEBE72|nr:hypothetical protein [Streptomyces hyaluromycini]